MRISCRWIMLLVVFVPGLLLSGCAAQQKAVSFSPKSHLEPAETRPEQKLEDMSYEELLAKGDEHLAQGNLKLAKLHFLQALTRESAEASLFARLGNLFLSEKNVEKSQVAFAEALRLDPENIPALLGSGRSARLAGDCLAAEPYLLQVQQLAPDNPEAPTELAICYDSQERAMEAEVLYRRVTELLPRQPAALNNLGFHYLLQGNFKQAVETLQAARMIAREDRLIKNNLAAAYILKGEETRGLAMFESSLGKAEAFNNIGYIQMTRGELQQAEQAFVQALELNPKYYVRAAKNLDYLRTLPSAEQAVQKEPTGNPRAVN